MRIKRYAYVPVLLVIIGALVAGVLLSDPSGGRFAGDGGERSFAAVSAVTGDVSIYRDGMSYVLKRNVGLRQADLIETGPRARLETCLVSGATVSMDADSRISLETLSEAEAEVAVLDGAAMIESEEPEAAQTLRVRADAVELEETERSSFSVESYRGTVTVCVFAGKPLLRCAGREYALIEGDRVVVVLDEERQPTSVTVSGMTPVALRDFLLDRLIQRGGLLYDTAQLREVLDARRRDTETHAMPPDGEGLTCTLEIRCDTVLDHPEVAAPEGGWPFPEDCVILPPTTVRFSEGDCVFDVLRRTCLSQGIDIDYTYTVAFGGYYVQMLSGLWQFDMGKDSGWMYKVNGWFPNYGSSLYLLQDGDVVVWAYSCEGLGADLGADFMSHPRE